MIYYFHFQYFQSWVVKYFSEMFNKCIFSMTPYVFTICFYDDDVLSLIKFVGSPVLLKEANQPIDSLQSSIEVGARLLSMACR